MPKIGIVGSKTMQLTIRTSVMLDGNELYHRDANDWESAEENFGKLQRQYEKKQAEAEDRAISEAEEERKVQE